MRPTYSMNEKIMTIVALKHKFSLLVPFFSNKFRRTVADITKPEHDDFYLIRWLNGEFEEISETKSDMYHELW